jgi:hypothetical protein
MFYPDPSDAEVSRTGLFSMFHFEDSEFVFFHCAVRVCRNGEDCSAVRLQSISVTFHGHSGLGWECNPNGEVTIDLELELGISCILFEFMTHLKCKNISDYVLWQHFLADF